MMMIDNYYNDRRVMAGEVNSWFESFNENKMTVLFRNNDDEQIEMPVEFIVCDTCRGKGSHVNPSIDCNGISSDEFYEDPNFFKDYKSGYYDVKCYECGGRRVIPWPILEEHQEIVEDWLREEWEYQAMCAAERRMGA